MSKTQKALAEAKRALQRLCRKIERRLPRKNIRVVATLWFTARAEGILDLSFFEVSGSKTDLRKNPYGGIISHIPTCDIRLLRCEEAKISEIVASVQDVISKRGVSK